MNAGPITPAQLRTRLTMKRVRDMHQAITEAGWTTLDPTFDNAAVIEAQYARLQSTERRVPRTPPAKPYRGR